MFVLAIAIYAATLAAPPAEPIAQTRAVRASRKARPVRRVRIRAARPLAVRHLIPVSNPVDRNAKYRLPLGNLEPTYDPKMSIVAKDSAMPCGITGAPVCPSKGTTVLKTSGD